MTHSYLRYRSKALMQLHILYSLEGKKKYSQFGAATPSPLRCSCRFGAAPSPQSRAGRPLRWASSLSVGRWQPRGVGRQRFPWDRRRRFLGRCAMAISGEECGGDLRGGRRRKHRFTQQRARGLGRPAGILLRYGYPNSIRKRKNTKLPLE